MSTESDSLEPDSSSENIEDLRSVLAGLEEEMENLETSLSDLKSEGDQAESAGPVVDPQLADLEDDTNQTRLSSRSLIPREAPEPLYEELGEEESDAIPGAGVVFDLNPKPNPDQVRPKRAPVSEQPKVVRDKAPRLSKRERKRLEREEKVRAREEERAKAAPVVSAETGDEDPREEPGERSMDDLELENPLPDATFAPDRDHSDLVMDRRQRRLEASAIAEQRERAQHEVWDQSDGSEEGEPDGRRSFSLPVYLVQAVLVSIAALLIVMGVRTAYKSMHDAKDGEEEQARSEIPNLKALGLIEATEVVQSYFEADGWQNKAEFVRKPAIARPRMERYYQSHTGEDAKVTGVEVVKPRYNAIEGGGGFLFQCRFPDDEVRPVPTVRIPSEAPYFVVDWEALVDYADVGWAAFLKARKAGSSGIFRTYGAEDTFYPEPFSDSEEYIGLKLYGKKKEVAAYGYIKRATVDGRELQQILNLWKQRQQIEGRGAGGSSLLERMLMGDSDNPQAVLDAMRTIRGLSEVEVDDGDLFGDKKFIKPEFWRPQKEAWAPMTIEVAFPEASGTSFLPQLEIVRFLAPNWIVGEERLELAPEALIPVP